MITKKRLIFIIFCTCWIWLIPNCKAQLKVDTTRSEVFLVEEILLGKGILAGNITYKGPPFAVAHFNDSSNTIGITEGILLSTGNVYYSLGPNRSPRTGWASNTSGDEDLDNITRGRTHDASVLEFDFITQSENLSFKYVFASEEYQEYVGSKFNDVFGFFLSGPNADKVNLALLPDGSTPITINNVNHENGEDYYIDNPYYNTTDPFVWDVRKRKVVKNKRYQKQAKLPSYNIQFDGFTVVLEAKYVVIPNEIYHIKMAVADVADGILDSGVFLEAGSFVSHGNEVVTINKVFKEDPIIREEERVVKIEPRSIIPDTLTPVIPNEIRTIEFAFDSSIIPDSSYYILQNISQVLSHYPELSITIIGHTDNKGSNEYNLDLSKRRSQAATKQLIDFGVRSNRITSRYRGEGNPVGSNSTTKGRAKNRRVEFELIKGTAQLR